MNVTRITVGHIVALTLDCMCSVWKLVQGETGEADGLNETNDSKKTCV